MEDADGRAFASPCERQRPQSLAQHMPHLAPHGISNTALALRLQGRCQPMGLLPLAHQLGQHREWRVVGGRGLVFRLLPSCMTAAAPESCCCSRQKKWCDVITHPTAVKSCVWDVSSCWC
jgi:hypothetical protein